jgi:hypothetical protein
MAGVGFVWVSDQRLTRPGTALNLLAYPPSAGTSSPFSSTTSSASVL